MNTDYPIAHELFDELWSSLGGNKVWLDRGSLSWPWCAFLSVCRDWLCRGDIRRSGHRRWRTPGGRGLAVLRDRRGSRDGERLVPHFPPRPFAAAVRVPAQGGVAAAV